MSILPRLQQIYERRGYRVLSGFNSYFFQNFRDAPFTKLLQPDGQLLGNDGLALQEVMFLEGLKDYVAPSTALVIGNAYGWSTIALSLIFPGARVAALDPLADGIELTRSLAAENGLPIAPIVGESPGDVAAVVRDQLGGKVDFVLIDALHTSEAVLADFQAAQPWSHERTLFVFHDVITWHLEDALFAVRDRGLQMRILTRTPSGMAIAYRTAPAELKDYVAVFHDDPEFFRSYRRFVVESFVDKVSKIVR
jgi:predicted O-methyltransferase YrrM